MLKPMKNLLTVQHTQASRQNTRRRLKLLLVLIAVLLLVAAAAEYIVPYDPYVQNLNQARLAPSGDHWLGTDRYGRDVLSRVLVGAGTSIFSTLLLAAGITMLGTLVGLACAHYGGWLDAALMRLADVFLAFPGLVLALAVAGVLGGGLHNAALALLLIAWPKYARLARSQALVVQQAPWIQACKMAGCSQLQLVFKHLLPNIMGPLLVTALLDIGTLMMELAALSFLGLGAKPPAAEWGSMLSDGRGLMSSAPWLVLGPGAAIFITVMLFNLLGDTLRDYLDPKARGAENGK